MTSPAAPDFSIKPTLTGEKVVLRPFAAADFPALLAALVLTGPAANARARSS